MDTLFVAPYPEELYTHSFVMGRERRQSPVADSASLCNAVIMAKAQADFTKIWLKAFHQSFNGSWDAHSTVLPFKLSNIYPDLIHIQPDRSFFHFDCSRRGLAQIFEHQPPTNLDGVFSIHLWAHTWWDPRSRHLSHFHNGRLTPAYLHRQKSTYATIAHAFLPVDCPGNDTEYFFQQAMMMIEDRLWTVRRRLGAIKRAFQP
jgi:hypothetical protein